MAKEFKVTVDTSLKAENSTGVLEKAMNDMSSAGWSLVHVTSFLDTTADVTPTPRIFMFWERETAARGEQLSGENQRFGDLVRKQLGGSSKG
jgi:hypothetical protein